MRLTEPLYHRDDVDPCLRFISANKEVVEFPLAKGDWVFTDHVRGYYIFTDRDHARTSVSVLILKYYNVGDRNEDFEVIKGNMRWDGCSNWDFPDDASLHVCDTDDFVQLFKALENLRLRVLPEAE